MLQFFIQARVGSTRLPNKVLLSFYNEKSILDIIVNKLQDNFKGIPIIICTSTNIHDNNIEQFCVKNKISCYRGEENNVLKRFTDAAIFYKAKTIIRICADNPFLDVQFLKELIQYYKENPNADYWSFKNSQQIPVIKTHYGFFSEIVTIEALDKVLFSTKNPLYLEHVTNYIYINSTFKTKLKLLPDFLKDRIDLRFTIDDSQDFELMKALYVYYIKNNCKLELTIEFVDKNKNYLSKMIENIKKYSK